MQLQQVFLNLIVNAIEAMVDPFYTTKLTASASALPLPFHHRGARWTAVGDHNQPRGAIFEFSLRGIA